MPPNRLPPGITPLFENGLDDDGTSVVPFAVGGDSAASKPTDSEPTYPTTVLPDQRWLFDKMADVSVKIRAQWFGTIFTQKRNAGPSAISAITRLLQTSTGQAMVSSLSNLQESSRRREKSLKRPWIVLYFVNPDSPWDREYLRPLDSAGRTIYPSEPDPKPTPYDPARNVIIVRSGEARGIYDNYGVVLGQRGVGLVEPESNLALTVFHELDHVWYAFKFNPADALYNQKHSDPRWTGHSADANDMAEPFAQQLSQFQTDLQEIERSAR